MHVHRDGKSQIHDRIMPPSRKKPLVKVTEWKKVKPEYAVACYGDPTRFVPRYKKVLCARKFWSL